MDTTKPNNVAYKQCSKCNDLKEPEKFYGRGLEDDEKLENELQLITPLIRVLPPPSVISYIPVIFFLL